MFAIFLFNRRSLVLHFTRSEILKFEIFACYTPNILTRININFIPSSNIMIKCEMLQVPLFSLLPYSIIQ